MDSGRETLHDYVISTWAPAYGSNLARKTQLHYESLLIKHVLPELGPLELRAITPETIARWQADRLACGYGRVAVRHAFDLLGSILQRALESGQVQTNPARAVRKAPRPRRPEVRPLPPATIERMRAASSPRDAALISVLAYAGLRPGEALALQWRDIREQTILVERALSLGEEKDTKTAAHRTVRLLPPLAADLREWRLRSGRPADKAPVFPSAAGTLWSQAAYQSWRRRAFRRALDGAGHRARSPLRPAPLLRLAAPPRGPVSDLRRAPARSRCTAHAEYLRPRDGRVRGRAAARGAHRHHERPILGRRPGPQRADAGNERRTPPPPDPEGAFGVHQFVVPRLLASTRDHSAYCSFAGILWTRQDTRRQP